VKAGRHSVAVDAEGVTPDRRDVDVAAKGEGVVTLTLARTEVAKKPPPEQGPATRAVVGWSLAGLAGAALITAGVTGLRAKTLADEYRDPASAHFQDTGARSEG
ncbi:hypothetical protein, partial [Escherichia coli]|uniref:hypothetical protein n=1 Tax=Escherichia coli TaxID=562 RepID=UPI00181BCD9A